MDPNASQFAVEFASHVPLYLVYVACAVLALVFWKRAPLACGLALTSAVVLLLCSVALMVLRHAYLRRANSSELTNEELSQVFAMLGIVGTVAHAIGSGLLVTAVFVGRRARAPSAA